MATTLELHKGFILEVNEKNEIELIIDSIIKKHAINKHEITQLVFESVTYLSAGDAKISELSSKGKIKSILDNLNGKNKKLQSEIDRSLQHAQYASQLTLQKLAEQNLMSFELITAVNEKLNHSMKYVNDEIKEIYENILVFFKNTQNEVWEIQSRLDRLEKNVKLLNWKNTLECRTFNGIEYNELHLYEKIICLIFDYHNMVGSNSTAFELILLKSAFKSLSEDPRKKINLKSFLYYICNDSRLIEMLQGKDNELHELDNYPVLAFVKKYLLLKTIQANTVNEIEQELSSHNVNVDKNQIRLNLAGRYLDSELSFDINDEISCFDLILVLLLYMQQNSSVKEKNTNVIETLSDEDMKSESDDSTYEVNLEINQKCWDIVNVNTVVKETEGFIYYLAESDNLYRVNKVNNVSEFLYKQNKETFKPINENRACNRRFDALILNDECILYVKKSENGKKDIVYSYNFLSKIESKLFEKNKICGLGLNSDQIIYFATEIIENNQLLRYEVFTYNLNTEITNLINRIELKPFEELILQTIWKTSAYKHRRFVSGPYVFYHITNFQDKILLIPNNTYDTPFTIILNNQVIEISYLPYCSELISKKGDELIFGTINSNNEIIFKNEYDFDFRCNINWSLMQLELSYISNANTASYTEGKIVYLNEETIFVNKNGINRKRLDDKVKVVLNQETHLKKHDFLEKKVEEYDVFKIGYFGKINVHNGFLYAVNYDDSSKVYRYNLLDSNEMIKIENNSLK